MHEQRVKIRRGTSHDVESVAKLAAQTFHEAFARDNKADDMATYVAASFSPAQIRSELADPRAIFLLAEVSQQTVGYAKLYVHDAPDCITGCDPVELVRLYVRENWLGSGTGAALMQACIEEAKTGNHKTLWLGVWENNKHARTFYQNWGFIDVGSHEFMLGEDVQIDILMERQL